MSIRDWFGRRKAHGRIYSMISVPEALRLEAESAISESRYVIRANLSDNRFVLIIQTNPPRAAIIKREPSLGGAAPDMIIQAVYCGDAEATAASLIESG